MINSSRAEKKNAGNKRSFLFKATTIALVLILTKTTHKTQQKYTKTNHAFSYKNQ